MEKDCFLEIILFLQISDRHPPFGKSERFIIILEAEIKDLSSVGV